MKPIGAHLIGRFGNQLFQAAFAIAWAEREGRELRTNSWAGQKIFQLEHGPLEPGIEMLPEHYRQDQDSLIYTREDAKRWFAWRPEVEAKLAFNVMCHPLLAHWRNGDYLSLGYPVVSQRAIQRALEAHGFDPEKLSLVSEEVPMRSNEFTGELTFAPDFYRMTKADVLFRSNSSFSWWAATLGNGRVFSPVIEGLRGGVEHDSVPFVEGNHPRLAELPGITDLHLS